LPEYWKGKIWLASESYCKLSELNQKLFLLKNNGDLTTSLINPIPRIQAHTDLFSLKVLIAEDNMINQVVLQEQLELLGCQVFTASDGEEALVIWDNEIVDIILTDVN
ncbi:response regulator, partial [Klebsiella pneumoniae]